RWEGDRWNAQCDANEKRRKAIPAASNALRHPSVLQSTLSGRREPDRTRAARLGPRQEPRDRFHGATVRHKGLDGRLGLQECSWGKPSNSKLLDELRRRHNSNPTPG